MDPTAIAAASGPVAPGVLRQAEQAQRAIAAQLIAGLEAGSRAVAAAAPGGDSVRISPEAQQLYQAYGNA